MELGGEWRERVVARRKGRWERKRGEGGWGGEGKRKERGNRGKEREGWEGGEGERREERKRDKGGTRRDRGQSRTLNWCNCGVTCFCVRN